MRIAEGREWGVGSREWGIKYHFLSPLPAPYSPFPTPYCLGVWSVEIFSDLSVRNKKTAPFPHLIEAELQLRGGFFALRISRFDHVADERSAR